MSIEFQIRSSVLATIVTRSVQQQLRETCFAPVGGFYVDHADVAPAAPKFSTGGGAVRVHVPADVFVVSRDAVLAAPNGVPDGATRPAGRVEIVLEMRANGANVSLSGVDVDLGPIGGALGAQGSALKAEIIAGIGSPLSFDLGVMLRLLQSPSPASSSVELAGETVCVRFDATGATIDRLIADHEWGVFVDEAAVKRLALSKVPQNLSSAITSLRPTPHWRPVGRTPHVDIDYEGAAQVPDPFSARVSGTFRCDISVIPTPAQLLRTTVSWTLNIDLGALVPAFIDNVVATAITTVLDPRKFGGTPLGFRSFFVDERLPDVEFSGGRLTYSSVAASPEGMTIGGSVRLLLDPTRETLKTSITAFSNPRFVVYASHHGCVFGWAGETPSINAIKVSASVGLEMSGEFCGFEVISPGDWIASYTAQGAVSFESRSVSISLPALTALHITEPVRILVRTSRGVRLIDLGKPHIEVDEEGNVLNAEGAYIDDCLYMTIWDWYWATLPIDPITGKPLPPPPKPWPPPEWDKSNLDWLTSPPEVDVWDSYIESLEALNVQLVTLTGLEPGELIQFRSFEHAVDITADASGRARVPVLLSFRNRLEPAKLTRVNRQNFKGTVAVQTAVFEWHNHLRAVQRNQIATAANGETYVIAESTDGEFAYRLGTLGAWSRLETAEIPKLDYADQASFEESFELPGLVSLIRLPGFPDEPIALAAMEDDSILVLDLAEGGHVRVAGTFMGPIGAIAETGEWGIAAARNRITAFTVTRSEILAGPSKKAY